MRCLLLLLFFPVVAFGSNGDSRVMAFDIEGTGFEGHLVLPEEREAPLPAILIVPDWMGPRPYFEKVAERIAERGYAVYVADVYGTDTRPKNTQEAARAANQLRSGDRAVLLSRALRNLELLREQPEVNSEKIIAIGFCFGGTTVLEMARSGADLTGVVSFHGNLDAPRRAQREGSIKAAVLVFHGDSDPYVPEGDVQAFQDEMRQVRADWEFMKFGGAVHSFTDPEADSPGARYDASAARRAWATFWDFCEEHLNK